jgi:phosphoglycerol transferase
MGKKKRNKSGQAVGSGAVATEIRQVSTPHPQGYSVAQASKPNFFTGTVFEWLAIAATSLLAFWFLTARLVGVQVSVLADEYLYLLDAHYKGLDEATYPNYLFQWIYSSTKLCGTEFYSCARSINAFFVIFGAIFIYLLAKHIGRSKWLGALAAVAAILGSYGTYTAYFMPEAIFNGLMMVFFWALIRFGKSDNLLVWAAIGTSLGIASLAKPHGLFVIPAIVIFVILWTRATKDKWLIAAALRSVVFVGSVVGSKFLFGYLLAGERALSLFGMYGTLESVAETATKTIATTASAGTSVLFTSWGQVLMISMILGLSLPVAIHGLILSLRKDPVVIESVKYRTLIGLLAVSLLPAIAVFESWQDLGVLMHTRYYSYLIPLALVGLIEGLVNTEPKTWKWAKYSVIAVFLGLAAVNLVTSALPFSSNWVDAPDFRMHIDIPAYSKFSILIAVGAAVLWLWRARATMLVALVLAILSAGFAGGHSTNFLITNFATQSAYDHVARILHSFLPEDEANRVIMFGNYELLQRTVFSALTGSAQIRPTLDSLAKSEIDPSHSWLVTFEDQVVTGFEEPTISGQAFKMYSLDLDNSLQPKHETIESFSSVCPEPSDRGWSCGNEVKISLLKPFSANATVDLIFEVSDWAAGKELEFSLGDFTFVGKFEKGLSSALLRFANSAPSDVLTIRINSSEMGDSTTPEPPFVRPIWGYASPTN